MREDTMSCTPHRDKHIFGTHKVSSIHRSVCHFTLLVKLEISNWQATPGTRGAIPDHLRKRREESDHQVKHRMGECIAVGSVHAVVGAGTMESQGNACQMAESRCIGAFYCRVDLGKAVIQYVGTATRCR